MASIFSPGDVVRLKSGGPEMTVKAADNPAEVECQWFNGKDNKEAWFPETSLEKVNQGPKTILRTSRPRGGGGWQSG